MKCPKTITGMVNALGKRYNPKHIKISHGYNYHAHLSNCMVKNYTFYIASEACEMDLTWKNLQGQVLYYLNKE